MISQLKNPLMEESFKRLEKLRTEIVEGELTYQNLEQLANKLSGQSDMFKGQISTFKSLYDSKVKELEEVEKAQKRANVKVDDNPFEANIKCTEDMLDVSLELFTWTSYMLNIYENYSFKLEQALKVAHGLSLTKETMDRIIKFIETRTSEEEKRFYTTVAAEREMFSKHYDALLQRTEFNERLLSELANALNKRKEELSKKFEPKLPISIKKGKPVILTSKEHVCEVCDESFSGEFLLYQHKDKKHKEKVTEESEINEHEVPDDATEDEE